MNVVILIHVAISLIAIITGFIVMSGMLDSRRMPSMTNTFLWTTILTNASGLIIPPLLFDKFLPSQAIAILSLVLLAIACFALYSQNLAGKWRWVYVLTALISLYLNTFVLVIQLFLRIPALSALAPGAPPSGPAFGVVQLMVLAFFAFMIFRVIRRYHPA
ncbi:hypothetical protein JQ628_08970 [Bradyrhizobium lablabi]|uniref:hypothetical protein n=1 Tax=Bradyrhizobium lablabi TaxID=722472 RepID=UPI001BAD2F94|nr:hypothetical protein [Bradyrhizobium lablabi]MBR1121639.1 hypothetical protein [Bradyrhizobium lablabi]